MIVAISSSSLEALLISFDMSPLDVIICHPWTLSLMQKPSSLLIIIAFDCLVISPHVDVFFLVNVKIVFLVNVKIACAKATFTVNYDVIIINIKIRYPS